MKKKTRQPLLSPFTGTQIVTPCEGADFSAPSSCSLRLMPGIE